MHGQQNDKYTEMHDQQNDKYTEMHGQQNIKKFYLHVAVRMTNGRRLRTFIGYKSYFTFLVCAMLNGVGLLFNIRLNSYQGRDLS
jgi:hypothetical protein